MYSNNYGMPTYETHVYEGVPYTNSYTTTTAGDGERFFLAPFLVGGLAGTALGSDDTQELFGQVRVDYRF